MNIETYISNIKFCFLVILCICYFMLASIDTAYLLKTNNKPDNNKMIFDIITKITTGMLFGLLAIKASNVFDTKNLIFNIIMLITAIITGILNGIMLYRIIRKMIKNQNE